MASSNPSAARRGQAHEKFVEGEYVPFDKPSEVVRDIIGKHDKISDLWWSGVAASGVFLVLGIIGFVIRVSDGVSDRGIWGYYVMMFAFLLTTTQAAPIVAIAMRMTNAHWRRPVSRAAELWTVAGLFNLILFIPMLWILPPLTDGRRSLWFYDAADPFYSKVPIYSPHIWATLALLGLVVTGLMLLYLSTLPDLALMRDNGSGWRQRWAAKLSRNWIGTTRQWNMLHHRMGILGAFYFMMLVFVHFLISIDFLLTLVPGWIDALFPVTHFANGLQAGVATVILTLVVLRQFGGYKDYIKIDQFWGLGKLLLALSLLWFWFWFSSFNVMWYGGKPNERAVFELLMFGAYQPAFFAGFALNFLTPLLVMVWNPVRKSIWGPTIMAVAVLAGTFFDRLRLYVAAYGVPGIGIKEVPKHELSMEAIGKAIMPGLPDVFIVLGAIGGAILFVLLASRLLPPVSIWEQKELVLYKTHKVFHRTKVLVLGKPR